MPCTFCDAPLPARARYCPNCGTAVMEPAAADEPVAWKSGGHPPTLAVGERAAAAQSSKALASLIFGILGWTALPIVGSIVAIILGHQARDEIRRAGGRLGGGDLATAGLILGYAMLLPFLLVLVVVVAALALGFGLAGLSALFGLALVAAPFFALAWLLGL